MSDKGTDFHIVIAPRELINPNALIDWLMKDATEYLVGSETGDGGHPHVDCYVIFKTARRADNVRRKLQQIYSSIPKEEWRNIRVIRNTIDADRRYGFGYSAKEGRIIASNLSKAYVQECVSYYLEKKDIVNSKKKGGFKAAEDKFAMLLIEFIKMQYHGGKYQDRMIYEGSTLWCGGTATDLFEGIFREFVTLMGERLAYSVFKKLDKPELAKYCQYLLRKEGGDILTAPPLNPSIGD